MKEKDNQALPGIDLDLDKLEALARAATPGPWDVNQASAMRNGKLVVDELYVYSPEARNVAIASDIANPATGEMSKANADYIAAANPATILALIAQARAAQAAVPVVAVPDEPKPTDLSQRLRAKANQPFGPEDFALLTQAAEEIERYYGGMVAWKKTAEKKDRDWNAERMSRVDDRCAARAAASQAAPVGAADERALYERALYEHWWHEGPHPFRDISKRKNCQLNEETAWMVWQACAAALATPPAPAQPAGAAQPVQGGEAVDTTESASRFDRIIEDYEAEGDHATLAPVAAQQGAAKAPAAQAVDAAEQRFIDQYYKATQTSKPEDWMEAALLAKQWSYALHKGDPSPASTPEASQQDAADEPLCPACQGSGEVVGMDGSGPDAYEVAAPCPHCGGTGGLLDAYNGLVALLAAEREKYLSACGKLFHASLAPQQAAAVAAPSEIPGEIAIAVPKEVRSALDRMCLPLHESRLSGATAKEDARCMDIIKRFIDGLAAPATATAATTGEDARDAARLDFIISEECQIEHFDRAAPTTIYRLRWPYREEHQREWSQSGRDAIDSAMRATQQEGE